MYLINIICYIAPENGTVEIVSYPRKHANFESSVSVYQRVNLHFLTVLLWFSQFHPAFPMIFQWFSFNFPIVLWVFLWFKRYENRGSKTLSAVFHRRRPHVPVVVDCVEAQRWKRADYNEMCMNIVIYTYIHISGWWFGTLLSFSHILEYDNVMPPSYKLVNITQSNYGEITTINHSYCSYKPT